MFDAGITLGLLGLLGGQASGAAKRQQAVRKLGVAAKRAGARAKRADEDLQECKRRLRAGEEKLSELRNVLTEERKTARAVADGFSKLARDLKTTSAKLPDVLERAAGLVREADGRWRLVSKSPAKPTPAPKPSTPSRPATPARKPSTPARPKAPPAPAPKPAPKPAPTPAPEPSAAPDPRKAARELRDYLRLPRANFGTRANPSATVRRAQRRMGGGLVRDGIVGPATRKRATQLGYTLPQRPAKPSSSPPARTLVSTATPAAPSRRSPTQAAQDLRTYLATRGANWGWQGTPSPTIKLAQLDMGSLTGDGIMGPATRRRASALGVTLPAAPVK